MHHWVEHQISTIFLFYLFKIFKVLKYRLIGIKFRIVLICISLYKMCFKHVNWNHNGEHIIFKGIVAIINMHIVIKDELWPFYSWNWSYLYKPHLASYHCSTVKLISSIPSALGIKCVAIRLSFYWYKYFHN